MKTNNKNSKGHSKPIQNNLDSGMPIQNRIWNMVKKWKSQFILSGIVVIFAILSFLNEVLDLPHLLGGAPLTPINWAEIVIDVVALFLVGSISIFMLSVVESKRKRAEEKIKHLNLVLRAIRNVNQLITKEKDRNRLLKGICGNLVKTRGYHNAWIALLDESRRAVTTAEAGLGKAFLPMVERLKRGELTDCGRRALGQSGVLTIEDPSSTCAGCPLSRNYTGGNAMSVRLKYGEKIYGLLNVSVPSGLTAGEEAESLFREVAEDIAFALHSIEQEEGRKRAEEALQISEQKFKDLTETTTDWVWEVDKNGVYTYVSPKVKELLGYEVSEVLGKTPFDLMPKEEAERIGKFFNEKVLNKEPFYILENENRHKDGHLVVLETSGIPIFDERGQLEGYRGIDRDITERKRAEEKLRLFSHSVDSSIDGIAMGDLEGRITCANETFVRMFGYSREELIGKEIAFIYPEDQMSKLKKATKAAIEGGWEGELIGKRKDGGLFPMAISASRVVDDEGNVIAHMASHRDITEKKKMEAQLIQAERLTAVGTLAYGIAHEFNNILAGILGNAEFGMGNDDPQEVAECFRVIMESCDRAKGITNSLLAFSRQREAKKQRADVTETVETVLGLVERELEKQNVKVVRKFKPIPEITCDLGELSGVVLNMITNARDAMKPDGGTLTIEIAKRGDNIEMIFTDTGCGIPDSIKSRIFEPFVTTKGALGQSEIPGTGLGLFLSYGIISRYHGKIGVKSEIGKGSKFTIKIPISKNQESPVLVETEAEKPTALPQNLNILLVDDEEPICIAIKKFFEVRGHSVATALSGKKGLKIFKKGSFDLVLADITMPDMDGMELISKLKKIDQQVKFIVLTGHIQEERLESAKRAGADEILMKPFRNEELYQVVGRVLSI